MGKLRALDDEFVSRALFRRPLVRAGLACVFGVFVGACAGALAWPLLTLGTSPSDYSVVAVPFVTVPAGAVLGALVTVGCLVWRRRG